MADKDERDEFHLKAQIPGVGHVGVRKKGSKSTLGVLLPMKEGMPLEPGSEVVNGSAREGEPGVYDLQTICKIEHKGPARVATNQYRSNYDQIFGAKPKKPVLN